MRYDPVDSVPGEARTVAAREQDCADRCARVTGCAHWSWWTDGGCHLSSSGEAVKIVHDDAVVAGHRCQGKSNPHGLCALANSRSTLRAVVLASWFEPASNAHCSFANLQDPMPP